MKQKKPLNLNPFVLIFAVVVVAWLFTFIITPGTLVDGVYTALPKNAFNFNNVFNLFRAVPMGIKDTSNLVILVLVIGGALEIYKSTGAIDSSITKMVHKFGSGSRTFLLIALMVLFSVIGGFLGWIETLIPFAPLVVAMILALGYDGIVACAVLIIGLMGGFVTGPTNLYTVGVCNGILQNMGLLSADSDVFVGLGFRAVLWAIMTIIGVLPYLNGIQLSTGTPVVLAGFLTILPEDVIQADPKRILNIHPSLIPSFCGAGFLIVRDFFHHALIGAVGKIHK